MNRDMIKNLIMGQHGYSEERAEKFLNDHKDIFEVDYVTKYHIDPSMMNIKNEFSDAARKIEIGRCSRLVKALCENGATREEISSTLVYIFVVLDAYKHNLNWRQCYVDNGIEGLKRKYN